MIVSASLSIGVSVPGGPDHIRRTARDILSRPEFQPTPESPLVVARRWVLHQLARFFDTIFGGGHFGILGAILALVVVVAIVAVIVLAVRGTRANPVVNAGFVVSGSRRPPADWLAEAAACEAAGNWRGALRCRYRALVAELAQRGVLDEVPGRTTGEYRQEVATALPRSAADFGGVTDLFERAWYGDEHADAQDAGQLREFAERVKAGSR